MAALIADGAGSNAVRMGNGAGSLRIGEEVNGCPVLVPLIVLRVATTVIAVREIARHVVAAVEKVMQ